MSIGVGGWRLPDTVGSRGHQPHQTGVTFVDMTTNDSEAENPHRWHMVAQESPTTVEVDRHTIDPC